MTLRKIPLEVLCPLTLPMHRLEHGWNMNMNMRFTSVSTLSSRLGFMRLLVCCGAVGPEVTTPCHSRTRRRRPGSASSQAVDNRHQRGHVVDIHDTAISNDATGPSVFKGGDRASFLRQLRKAACENDFPIDDASGRTKLSCKGRCRRIDLPVSAVRFTHNTVDGHPVFLHDENAQSKKTSLWTFHICPCR